LLARTDSSGTVYYHTDGGGNVTALVDGHGNLVARYIYDPYGNLMGSAGGKAEANTYRFSTKDYDPRAGLYYYGFRWYDPNLQRFINRDPIGEAGGINLYQFVRNNPINAVDRNGLDYYAVPAPFGGGADYPYYYGDTIGEDLAAIPYNVGAAFANTMGGIGAGINAFGNWFFGPGGGDWLSTGLPEFGWLGRIGGKVPCPNRAPPNAYSVGFNMRLAPESYPGLSRAAHFQEANEALLSAMESDAGFARSMEQLGVSLERTPNGLAPRQSPADWTWHHAGGLGQMELVPRYQHTPGSDFWDLLHPGNYGGYYIWGK
jgi:RHS repeat-associated protein